MSLKSLGNVTKAFQTLGSSILFMSDAELKAALAAKGLTVAEQEVAMQMIATAGAEGGLAASTTGLTAVFKGLWMTIAAHPLISIAAAVGAVALAVSRYHKAMQEERQEIVDRGKEAKKEAVQKHVPMPYENLYLDIRDYNKWLYATRQESLNSREAYQAYRFDLTEYGLDSQVFGVIRIPKMELEMPLYLGASDENMSNGAAVLAQTSIPIGGSSTNSVIAGHRSRNGYKYFLDIELLEVGDEVYITNL